MKIELRNWITRGVIFSHECEGNSIKKTVEEAVKQGISLARADLTDANLSGADLTDANLAGANLYKADLSEANLSEAYLRKAILYKADLSGAKLVGTDLSDARLVGADLSGAKFDVSQKDTILKAMGLVFNEGKEEK